jgi:acetyl-CoA synthetase
LAAGLKALVRERLAAYEVPREIEFVDELPLTTSGKDPEQRTTAA